MATPLTELELYAENTGSLYDDLTGHRKRLVTLMAAGKYNRQHGVSAFKKWADKASKSYKREIKLNYGGRGLHAFTDSVRQEYAESLAKEFEAEAALGEYAHLLPAKAKREIKSAEVTKPSKKQELERDLCLTLRQISDGQGPAGTRAFEEAKRRKLINRNKNGNTYVTKAGKAFLAKFCK